MANHRGVKFSKVTCWYHEQGKSCRHMTSKNLLQHSLTALLYLKFLLIKQHEVPFIKISEATKGQETEVKQKMVNVHECTNVTNCKSHVGLSTQFYTTWLWFCSRNPGSLWFFLQTMEILTSASRVVDLHRRLQQGLNSSLRNGLAQQHSMFFLTHTWHRLWRNNLDFFRNGKSQIFK